MQSYHQTDLRKELKYAWKHSAKANNNKQKVRFPKLFHNLLQLTIPKRQLCKFVSAAYQNREWKMHDMDDHANSPSAPPPPPIFLAVAHYLSTCNPPPLDTNQS